MHLNKLLSSIVPFLFNQSLYTLFICTLGVTFNNNTQKSSMLFCLIIIENLFSFFVHEYLNFKINVLN